MCGGDASLRQTTLTSLVLAVLDRTDSSFVLANARVVDYPAVYCNDGFCKLSGYSRAELMQRGANCSFMAGELTNRETIRRIDVCLENNEQEQVEILLYKKNSKSLDQYTRRRPFWSEASTTRLHLTTAQPLGGRGSRVGLPQNLDGPPQLFDEECDYRYTTACSA